MDAAAVRHFQEQAASGGVDRTQDAHVGREADAAVRVARRELEIDDRRVAGMIGRHGELRLALQLLVWQARQKHGTGIDLQVESDERSRRARC